MDFEVLLLNQAVDILNNLDSHKNNDNAYSFVRLVKDRFKYDVETYRNFFTILAKRTDKRSIALEVKALFREHEDLFLRFTAFLPPKYRGEFCAQETQEAVQYLYKIKVLGNENVYKEFINILMNFKKHNLSVPQVCDQVSLLFQDYPDLLEGFCNFMPLCQDCVHHSTNHIHPQENVAGDTEMEEKENDETESEWVVITYLLEEMTL